MNYTILWIDNRLISDDGLISFIMDNSIFREYVFSDFYVLIRLETNCLVNTFYVDIYSLTYNNYSLEIISHMKVVK